MECVAPLPNTPPTPSATWPSGFEVASAHAACVPVSSRTSTAAPACARRPSHGLVAPPDGVVPPPPGVPSPVPPLGAPLPPLPLGDPVPPLGVVFPPPPLGV